MGVHKVPGAEVYITSSIDPRQEDPVEFAMRTIEVEENAKGWDRPAKLYMISLIPGAGLIFAEANMPPNYFDEPPPALEALAVALKEDEELREMAVPQGLIPDNLFGVAFMCEGWGIKRKVEDGVPTERPSEAADRIETRMFIAITAGQPVGEHGSPDHDKCGDLHYLSRDRGEIPKLEKVTNLFHTRQEDNPHMSGRVPNALGHVFVQAMGLSRRDPVL